MYNVRDWTTVHSVVASFPEFSRLLIYFQSVSGSPYIMCASNSTLFNLEGVNGVIRYVSVKRTREVGLICFSPSETEIADECS